MTIKRLLVVIAVLLLANTSFAQSGRLNDLASQLANEAARFADSSYSDYTRAFRNSGNDLGAVMAAQQFSAGAQLFNRMVTDRRRNRELREAFTLLQNSARAADRNDLQRGGWSSLQRLMSDISRELNSDSSGDNNNQYPWPDQGGPSRSGRMTWKGTVDDNVLISVRGGSAQVETIGGSPYYDAVTNFTSSLPPRRVNVRLQKIRGRGELFIEQQPSRENDYTAIVRIRDPKGGPSDYEFELSW
jgi:hypothetical protein